MFKHVFDELSRELSGENARNMAGDIWRWDRTCSFSSYYKSARYCRDRLREAGCEDVRIISFPADGKTTYGQLTIQKAWDCADAELTILDPPEHRGRLVSYRDEPYCLAQGSPPTPKKGIEAEVIAIGNAANAKSWKGVRARGKIVLIDTSPRSVHEIAAKRGAAGLITDSMGTNPLVRPTPMDLPDATGWHTLRPQGKCFAFVLSPRQGKALRDLIGKGKPVRLHAKVESRLYNGRSEMVSAVVPARGKNMQEVALIAHLYEPGANDNASGAALCIEIVRAINRLIRQGRLPKPRRKIRVLLTHEFQSLNSYIIARPKEARRIIAAANIDFVGQDQDLCKSALTYQVNPESLPCFIDHYMKEIVGHFKRQFHSPKNPSGPAYYKTTAERFWRNDNIISDPSLGIPSIAFINWPDRFYHTSADTEDKIHPPSIKRVGEIAGTWAYGIASAGLAEAKWLADCVASWSEKNLAEGVERVIEETRTKRESMTKPRNADFTKLFRDALASAEQYIDYLTDRELKALLSVGTLVSPRKAAELREHIIDMDKEIRVTARLWRRRAGRRIRWMARREGVDVREPEKPETLAAEEKRAAKMIPVRKVPGMWFDEKLPDPIRKKLGKLRGKGMPELPHYWVDGKRTLLDICRKTRQERRGGETDVARMIEWAKLMEKAGVIEIIRR
ncbi:MAG: M28 family peptidase [Planctomycetes bacterium]|nr:M28 family peptidase [Planctomycetota bacterium]